MSRGDRVSLSMQASTDAASPQLATANMLRMVVKESDSLGISAKSRSNLEDSQSAAVRGKLSASAIVRLLLYCQAKGAVIPNEDAVLQEAMAAAAMGDLGRQMNAIPKEYVDMLQRAAAVMSQSPDDIVTVGILRGDAARRLVGEFTRER